MQPFSCLPSENPLTTHHSRGRKLCLRHQFHLGTRFKDCIATTDMTKTQAGKSKAGEAKNCLNQFNHLQLVLNQISHFLINLAKQSYAHQLNSKSYYTSLQKYNIGRYFFLKNGIGNVITYNHL